MKVMRAIKSAIIALATAVTLSSFTMGTMTVYAAEPGSDTKIINDVSSGKTGGLIKGTNTLEAKYGNDYEYYQDGSGTYWYKNVSNSGGANGSGGNSGNGPGVNQEIAGQMDSNFDLIDSLDLKPDIAEANGAIAGFLPALRIFIGVILVLITVGMTMFSAFDIVYITMPPFRNWCGEAAAGNKGAAGAAATKTDRNSGETKLRIVTDEAQYAVTAAETLQSGKNPLTIYFAKRVFSYIILAVLLFILFTGNITLIANLAVRAVSGILSLINNI